MSHFEFVSKRRSMIATGVAATVIPRAWTGKEVAKSIEEVMNASIKGAEEAPEIIVGAIPFDVRRPGLLYRPAHVVVEQVSPQNLVDFSTNQLDISEQWPNPDNYCEMVNQAIQEIISGTMEKVVLGRCLNVEVSPAPSPGKLFAHLRKENPDAYVFRLDFDGKMGGFFEEPGVLLGASPELVLSCSDFRVCTFPLAGTTPRSSDPVRDAEAARALLLSYKDLIEHAHVSRTVIEVFCRHTDEVQFPSEPQLVATPVVWHLGTLIEGVLREGYSPMELLYELHPTPAVCGWPSDPARDFITRHENFDRGLFSGLIGWMDSSGDCEWALVLRAGVLRADHVIVFAGAGIISVSDPVLELSETATKMMTFIRALGELVNPLTADLHTSGNPAADASG